MGDSDTKTALILAGQGIQPDLIKPPVEQTATVMCPAQLLNQEVHVSPELVVEPGKSPANPQGSRIRGGDSSLPANPRNLRAPMAAAKLVAQLGQGNHDAASGLRQIPHANLRGLTPAWKPVQSLMGSSH
jgi:hypothetical protein